MPKRRKPTIFKSAYYHSKKERDCDGYKYVVENTTEEERIKLGFSLDDLQQKIGKGEQYLYRAGIDDDHSFNAMYISLKSFEVLRKKYFGMEDK